MSEKWHKLPFGQDLAGWSIWKSLHQYDWLESEIGYWNFDFDHKYLYFKREEDKIKFILRWL